MGFKDDALTLAMQVSTRKEHITNEETTKHSLIIPFIQLLGYDVFNPVEVKPEYVADFGKKKGEKVDYAIFKNGNPIIFIEAKSVNEQLDNHDAQLSRYFNSTPELKIGILTNGVRYKLFTDLNQNNLMDNSPFFEIDIENIKETDIEALMQFRKDAFDTQMLVKFAEELVYMAGINRALRELFKNPSDEFIRFLIKDVGEFRVTSNVIDRFRPIVKKCIQTTLVDIISKGILKGNDEQIAESITLQDGVAVEEKAEVCDSKKTPVTSAEELRTYQQIIEILSTAGKDTSRIVPKDTINYFSINYKNSSGWFLRFNIDSSFKYIISRLPLETSKTLSNGLPTEQAPKGWGESRLLLQSANDIKGLGDFIVKSFEAVENS